MAGHLAREGASKKWPIERKGTTYVVKPRENTEEGVPFLIVLREMTKLAQNRREAQRIIHSKQVLGNGKPIKDDKNNMLLFDTLNIIPLKKCYRLELSENGKFYLDEINESESEKKIAKVIGKKVLKGKKTQLNLSDGRNFLSDIKCDMNDSVLINLKDGKLEKCIPMKEKTNVVVFSGKHIGKKGEVIQLNLKEKIAKIKVKDKEINILINQLIAIE
jgi:small subunit ribosomal protein S4e